MTVNRRNTTPVNACQAFSSPERKAIKQLVDNLSTTKYVTAAAAYNGEITPLTFNQLTAGRVYKVHAIIGTAAAETITINIPAVNYLLGHGFSTDVGTDTTCAIKTVKFTATDPAITMADAQAGLAEFNFLFSPSADGPLIVQTSASETIGAGSFVTLSQVD